MGTVMDKVALEWNFSGYLNFHCQISIHQLLQIHQLACHQLLQMFDTDRVIK